MPQTFLAVQCFNCETFQVHQSKKSNKWICVICTSKQSVRKVYGQGTGKICRGLVQTLNVARHTVENHVVEENNCYTDHHDYNDNDNDNHNSNPHGTPFEEDHDYNHNNTEDTYNTNNDNLPWANGMDATYNEYSGDTDTEASFIPNNYGEDANEQYEPSNSQTWLTSNNNTNQTTMDCRYKVLDSNRPDLPNHTNSSHDGSRESPSTKVDKWNVFLPEEQAHVMDHPTFDQDEQYTTSVPRIAANNRKKPGVNKRRQQSTKNTADSRPSKRSNNTGLTRHTALDTEIIDTTIQNEKFTHSPTRNNDVEVIRKTPTSTKKQRQQLVEISNPSPQDTPIPKVGKWGMFLSS